MGAKARLKRTIAFYPPLIAVYPILAVFAANASMLPASDLWRPLGVGLIVSICVWLLASIPYRSTTKGAFVATGGFAAFWLVQPLMASTIEDRYWMIWLGVALLIALACFVAAKWKPPTAILNLCSTLLIAFTGVQTASHLLGARILPAKTTKSGPASKVKLKDLPDVYYIILDGYGRSDALREYLGYDNSAFVRGLESKGFWVGKRSRANYCQTALSLASSMNLETIQTLFPKADTRSDFRDSLHEVVRNARVFRMFDDCGYMTVGISTGFTGLTRFKVDINLAEPVQYSLLETTIMERTPMAAAPAFMKSAFDNRRKLLLGAFENLQKQAMPTAKPKFVFAHILAPHPPFVFGPNGEPRRKGGYFFFDGSDYLENIGDAESYKTGYADQAEYINKLVLSTLDKILAQSGRPKIIIVQGDHGSKLKLAQNSLERTDVDECFANLMAVYGPKELTTQLADDESPVNLMRKVVDEALHTHLPPLPNRSYYSPFIRPFDFTEITGRLSGSVANPSNH